MPNNEQNFIEIDSERFELIDGIDNIPVVDSFVKKNKIGRGSGEARLYVGSQKTRNFDDFFNGFQDKGFFLKKDFGSFM